jgi:hypothetical protein
MKRLLYALLRWSNDVNAVQKGKVGRRIGRRIVGRETGRWMRSLFR